jgi:site-specific recombinase XerD
METRFSLLFYLKKPKNYVDGIMPIYMRLTVNGINKEMSTGRHCNPQQWNSRGGRVNGNSENAKRINKNIDKLKVKMDETHDNLIREKIEITTETMWNDFNGFKEAPKSLLTVFQDHNDKIKALIGRDFTKGTLTKYNTTKKHVELFMKSRLRISDIEVKRIEYVFITEFDFYLRNTCGCANNSAIKHLKNLGKIMRECLAKKWITHDPFAGHKNKLKKVDRVKLSEEELLRMQEKQITNKRLGQVRDIFLFCCYTGLAYVDVQKLSRTNIQIGIDGGQWIFINRHKTAVASHIPLLPVAAEMVEKYREHPECEISGKVFPVSSNQKMNAYLKELADLCGIEKLLTFHIARHTFATTITLNKDVPIESVSKMLGHTDIRTTQIYAKVMDIKVSRDMKELRNKLA